MGTDPEKLYNCIMVYDGNEYWLSIEAINENGIGPKSKVLKFD
jgi:xylan 1,4-beta-xylosidase